MIGILITHPEYNIQKRPLYSYPQTVNKYSVPCRREVRALNGSRKLLKRIEFFCDQSYFYRIHVVVRK